MDILYRKRKFQLSLRHVNAVVFRLLLVMCCNLEFSELFLSINYSKNLLCVTGGGVGGCVCVGSRWSINERMSPTFLCIFFYCYCIE